MDIINNAVNYIMGGLLGIVGLMLLFLLLFWLRNPIIAKLGIRNIPRRPLQSALIVIGLTLSTAIIVSSLSLGDTLNNSVKEQAVAAYGDIDEVLAPPLLGTLAQLGILTAEGPADPTQSDGTTTEPQLLQGGLSSILALLQDGLPGISEERYAELRAAAAEEPLIDAIAPSILFPTIIRDTSSGQGEPFGFIFAVDEDYQESFGLQTVDGAPVDMASLRPGVGNVFEMAANLFGLVSRTTTDVAQRLGVQDVNVAEVAIGAAALGTVLSQVDLQDLQNLDLNELQNLDLNNLSLETLNQLGLSDVVSDTLGTTDLQTVSESLLSSINLNTLGQEIDRVLGQAGLELRHGEVYLNRVGAQQLNARVGDVLEIYIGPIPLPYRVKDIVDQAGPLATLTPVVVMNMDEAQRLLFMEGRVNNVLISNQGDALEGIEHTSAVSERLRLLSMNEEGVERFVEILRRPEVRRILDPAIEREVADLTFADEEDGPPEFIANILQEVLPIGSMARDLQTLQTELDKPGISNELRRVLSGQFMRVWLMDVNGLPADVQEEGFAAIQQLTELDLLDALSKQTVMSAASVGGVAFSSIFSVFGFFSILAGVILIFMIFVMLAAERRSEMGMARAIGMQRRHLVQMFVTEGAIYDLVAAAVGVLLGLGISYLLLGLVNGVFTDITTSVSDQINSAVFRLRFSVIPTSIVIAYCLGVLFTFIVVTFSSWRVSRLNIVAAMHDLPESSFTKRRSLLTRLFNFVIGPLLAAAGFYIIFLESTLEVTRTQLGASLALAGIALFLGWLLSLTNLRDEPRDRLVYSLMGIGLLVLWVAPWSEWLGGAGSIFEQNPATVLLSFIASGPLLILGAILTVIFNADALLWGVNRLLGGIGALTPVLKTAIAYPLNARFRTGMAMLLFAMIISTVTIMSVVIEATQQIVTPAQERSAGFEIQVSKTLLSFFNPINDLEAEIARHADFPSDLVAAVARISSLQVDAHQDEEGRLSALNVTGVNSGYVEQARQVYTFQSRAPGFESDEAVWQALQTRDDVAVVATSRIVGTDSDSFDGDFEENQPGPRGRRLPPLRLTGITLSEDVGSVDQLPEAYVTLSYSDETLANAPTYTKTVQVIGVLTQDTTLAGGSFQVNEGVIEALTRKPIEPNAIYVKAAAGADVRTVAQEIERAFLSGGLNTTLLAEQFAQGQAITRGILRLFQAFMALGLLVGIAALGVISSRTVVERRQQIGMLRAIGYQPGMVALSFVLEASFIALVGIGIGTITGVVLGQNMIGQFYSAITDGATFPIPWGQIGVILLVAYLFSLLMTILPALQASRIYPAEALRYD